MVAGESSGSDVRAREDDPAAEYAHRLAALRRIQSAQKARERRLGLAKLALAAVTVVAAFLLLHHLKALELLLIPVAVFLILAVLQERLIRQLNLRARAIAFYERGLARIEDRWQGSGETGERFLDPLHPYARDLDIFGAGSVFALLCTARTRAGEETLAAWLLTAAPVDEVLLRQEAIRDLKDRVDFREKLCLLGETVLGEMMRVGVQPGALAAWGERTPIFAARLTRMATRALAAMWLLSMVAWGVWGLGSIAGAMTILNLAWAHRIYRRQEQAAELLEQAADGLEVLGGVLALLEKEPFQAAKLIRLQADLRREEVRPSERIQQLARLAEIVKQRQNRFLKPFDLFLFWSAQSVFAVERWQQKHGPAIRDWLRVVGEMEALTAISGYAFEHPDDVFPEFVQDETVFHATGLAHPLLAAGKAVRNDLSLGREPQVIVLSGPNMAGKSTFIRSIGVNAVLALCGAPVRATRLRLSPLQVAASICILDSLSGGVSRFYAEIHRVKLISDLSAGGVPVLFLLDELLSGTNSHGRLAGSEFVVRRLMERNAIGLVSTHDLALTAIPDGLGARAANFHFEDQVENGLLVFDYKLKPGVVRTSNALRLMRSIGLGVDA